MNGNEVTSSDGNKSIFPKNSDSGGQRKTGMIQKKYSSLHVSHYPILLLSTNNSFEDNQHPSVTWRSSVQDDELKITEDSPGRKISVPTRIGKISLTPKTSVDRVVKPNRNVSHTKSAGLLSTKNEKTALKGATCSSTGRLHASPKMSFSSVVEQTMKAHAGMGSGRCLSSASPITAAQRKQLWGTSMHHSFDDRPTASSEDLFASCNDIDQAYRQQRKRRAGISGGSTASPFACSGGNGYSSAGITNGKGYPSLGGRSPQSSFDSNQDVAQISMNWMRMNGLGPSLRPFLNSNHTPKKTVIHNSQSSTHISRLGSLRRMNAEASIDGKISLSGTQNDIRIDCLEILFELSPSFLTKPQTTATSKAASGSSSISGNVESVGGGGSCNLRATHSTSNIAYHNLHHNTSSSSCDNIIPTSTPPTAATTATSHPSDLAECQHQPKSILRAPRLISAPKQLSFDVPASPTPTPKSSCVSASGSIHMFERPSRIRVGKLSFGGMSYAQSTHQGHVALTTNGTPVFAYNGRNSISPCGTTRRDPSRWRLSDLKQRSNSESMFRNIDMDFIGNGGRRMSMAYLPSREQALLRRILGPQGLSWISTDRESASRKSVSIAYSNDLEAGGKGGGNGGNDDSTIPLMNDKDENSGGRLIKRECLHDRRRVVCDKALAFAITGIILMIIENELRSANIIRTGSPLSIALKMCIMTTTAALLSFVGYFHVIEIQLFMNANAAEDWMVALSFQRISQIIAEVFICMLCPLPVELLFNPNERIYGKTIHAINVFLSIIMFFRLYWLCRVMLLHSRLFTDASSRSIAGLNRVNFNTRFIMKTLMTLCPGTMLMIFTASLWVIAGWILRLCEREYLAPEQKKEMDYINSIWLIAITFLSVGYGDIVPKTYCGRSMAVVTGIMGTCASSMVVAVIARKLELTRAEKHVHSFMQDTQLTKQLKHSAANVLRETWFIYKYRKLVDKCDFRKVRKHQRKFLLAIYERVKRDQRKLAENLVSLGDVAKTSSNTYELIQDVHSTQEGLSLRITAIEHQLSDISRELSNLADLLRGTEQRKKSVLINENSPQQSRLRRKIGELRV